MMASRRGAAATAARGRKATDAVQRAPAAKTTARRPRQPSVDDIVARCERDEAFRERLLARLAAAEGDAQAGGGGGTAADDDGADAGGTPAADAGNPGNVSVRVAPRYLKTFRLRIGTINWNRND
jgi:hypothetical protein